MLYSVGFETRYEEFTDLNAYRNYSVKIISFTFSEKQELLTSGFDDSTNVRTNQSGKKHFLEIKLHLGYAL